MMGAAPWAEWPPIARRLQLEVGALMQDLESKEWVFPGSMVTVKMNLQALHASPYAADATLASDSLIILETKKAAMTAEHQKEVAETMRLLQDVVCLAFTRTLGPDETEALIMSTRMPSEEASPVVSSPGWGTHATNCTEHGSITHQQIVTDVCVAPVDAERTVNQQRYRRHALLRQLLVHQLRPRPLSRLRLTQKKNI